MRRIKELFGIIMPFVFLIIFIFVYWPVGETKADTTVYQVNIATSPASGFLKAVNMAPGDQVTSILKVKNQGNLDFNYTVGARRETGSADLYDKLKVKVFDSKGIFYEGSFSDLKDLSLGTIAKAQQQDLTFTAELPKEVDNSLQGNSTIIAFDFTTIDHNQEVRIGDECFEPPFSNHNFTLHQKSTVPIKFHLHNSNGVPDTALRNNVRLEVTGPGVKGGTVKYIFSVSDGTLSFDQKVDEPHYHARFSTFDYPVVNDGTYTAIVYEGTRVLCQKEFVVLKQGNRSNSSNQN